MKLGLPRRVVVYYLFFCMATICSLSVAAVIAANSISSSQSDNSRLSQLGRAAATIEVEYVRHGWENLSEFAKRLKSELGLSYCGIAGVDGEFIAHSSPSMSGSRAVLRLGSVSRWGDVEQISYQDDHSRQMSEFRVPLIANQEHLGVLYAGVPEPKFWKSVASGADVTSLVVLLPLLLVGVGAIVLSRVASPLADVEAELRRIAALPLGDSIEMKHQSPRSAAALGWNRVIEALEDKRETSPELRTNTLPSASTKEAAIPDSEEIIAQIPEGVAVTDTRAVVKLVNPAMAALLGMGDEPDSLLETRIEDLLRDAGASQDSASILESKNLQRTAITTLTIQVEQHKRVLRVARSPRRSGEGKLLGHIWLVRDATQQQLAEEARDQFIDAATHELRTPLANIKAYAETLVTMDDLDVERQKEFCNTINSEATRLARFVDDLLSVSSMEAGVLTVSRQNVDTMRLLEEVAEKVRPLVVQKNLEFETAIPPKLPEMSIDKDKIVATLVNLLGNAVKYTPAGGRVALRVKTSDRELHLDVVDNGVGIDSDEIPKVFDKFFRSENPLVAEQVGTGLGLSLAREVVRGHGGEISVDSEIGKGSTFSITLPLGDR